MPRRHVRGRRTLLLERATSEIAERKHAAQLNRAHNAAMQMPSHVWKHGVVEIVDQPVSSSNFLSDGTFDDGEEGTTPSEDPTAAGRTGFLPDLGDPSAFLVERTCALLTGLAMLVADDAEEARTGDAFCRLVELPFLQTLPAAPDARRIALVDGAWVFYSHGRNGLTVHLRGEGLDGLFSCAQALLNSR